MKGSKNKYLGRELNLSEEGGGGSEPIPSTLSEKVRDDLTWRGGGVIPKIPIPKRLFF